MARRKQGAEASKGIAPVLTIGPSSGMEESDTTEFKQSWSDDAMCDLAAFANTRGGTVYIGINKGGFVVSGVDVSDQEQQAVANKILAHLSLAADIRVAEYGTFRTLVIRVDQASSPILLRGNYYTRVGTVSMPLPRDQLSRMLLKHINNSWDELPSNTALDDLDEARVRAFIRSVKSRPNPRLSDAIQETDPLDVVLRNLDLMTGGRPTNAAVLLFGKSPQRWFRAARVSIAYFRDLDDFDAYPDATGTIFEQIDTVMRAISMTNPARVTFPEGISTDEIVERTRRHETSTYPELAIKEAVTNALVHRDYTRVGMEVQIRMYPDRLVIISPGGLMPGLTLGSLLKTPHPSERRNPLVAQACFIDYWVERYGTGTTRMIDLCRKSGLPDPEFSVDGESFHVTFRRNALTEDWMREQGLNERQIKAVLYMTTHGAMQNKLYMQVTDATNRTATRDLEDLAERGIVRREGTTRDARYLIAK